MAAPVNTVLPAISGTLEVGLSLTTTDGTWTGGVHSYAYQWYRVNSNTEAISGATQSRYTITPLDCLHSLYVVVTATNNTGSTAATAATVGPIPEDWFVVEDGTGLADAVSYISLADADTYHARRNNTAWAALTHGQKEAALVKATQYMVDRYRLRWAGSRATTTQALDWPRSYVEWEDQESLISAYAYYPADQVPVEVRDACAELAYQSLSAELYAEQGQGVVREKVGPLEVEYDRYSPQARRFPAVDGRLSVFLTAVTTLVRR